MTPLPEDRLQTDGKFFRRAGRRLWLRMVSYGPFPKDRTPDHQKEFGRIREAGFEAIRLFHLPEPGWLDAAKEAGLLVFAGLDWHQHVDFLAQGGAYTAAKVRLAGWLGKQAKHPALAGVFVGNEIPADLVRWMGPSVVRESLEELIAEGKLAAPHLIFAYANYPSTEYLEPGNADVSAFNIYLEQKEEFRAYLRRLQNIAGDRPLLVSEFGLDSVRHSLEAQAAAMAWALEVSHEEETAGFTAYAWSDLWWNNGREVTDWDFGITARNGCEKPAYEVCRSFSPPALPSPVHRYSVIVCTRNGAARIRACLEAIGRLEGGPHEILVVDDGSTDGTADRVRADFPGVRLVSLPPSGLSAARNAGAAAATGEILAFTDDDCEPDAEWLVRLDRAFRDPDVAAAGGPNLPPPARNEREAVIRAAPGAPSHVLMDDTKAEHLPGCNLAVRREVFHDIGGFDPIFHTAGDDVDFCWRLTQDGHRMAFVPGAFVWHWRRPSIRAFLKQQLGYGRAEKLLMAKHPTRFGRNGEARWLGFVYGGGAVRVADGSVIYHGPMGQAGYQAIMNRMLPLRPLDPAFRSVRCQRLLAFIFILQPLARRWARNRRILPILSLRTPDREERPHEYAITGNETLHRQQVLQALLEKGWQAGGETDGWDLQKNGLRVLVALEHCGPFMNRVLLRVWGDPTEAEAFARELGAHPI